VRDGAAAIDDVEVVLCPPFTALGVVAPALRGSRVALGAQDVHWERQGAFTGEVSAEMLADAGCAWVIVGHSERRTLFGETDETVRRKAEAVLAAGMRPIVCVGETLAERDAGITDEVVERQVRGGLAGLEGLDRVVVAYEPVWAIGTGRTATAEQAQDCHAHIRRLLGEIGGAGVAGRLRIQYGGSVKPENAAELFGRPDVDGGLIGGASLDAVAFLRIVGAASAR